ncbi:hypothetical protein [Microvirga lupini]|uniref:hypothetical protein n=1 Tax=Microvirga lupini TaxID=420324 RepID=UPI001621668F|nr:hypothetical protein [Microvirga lupini]
MNCDFLSPMTDVEPQAHLASGIGKSAMLGRAEFIVLSLSLGQNPLHELIMKVNRDVHPDQGFTHSLLMEFFRILQA